MSTGGQFCLRWNNHQPNMVSVFTSLLQNDQLVDVTLLAENNEIHAHKIVLSACSPYFQSLFIRNPCKHPVIILADVKFIYLKNLVEFMYNGEINIFQDHLPELLRVAELLKVKGLEEIPSFDFTNEMEQQQQQHQHQQQQQQQQQPNSETNDSDENDEMNVAEYLHSTEPENGAPNGISDIIEINESMDVKPIIENKLSDDIDAIPVAATSSNPASFRRLRSTSAISQITATVVEMPVAVANERKAPYFSSGAIATSTTDVAKTMANVPPSMAPSARPPASAPAATATATSSLSDVKDEKIFPSLSPGRWQPHSSDGASATDTANASVKSQKCNPTGGGKRKLIRQNENFIRALEAVRFEGIGFCKAARMHGVNNRTLWLEYQKLGYPTKKPRKKQSDS